MKAYNLCAVNNLQYQEVKYPDCPEGWSIVKVKAAGICSSDIPRIFTKGTYHFPTIPGHEFSGRVEAVSDVENQRLVGKKVAVFPLIPCRKCAQCKTGHYEMCENYDYIGSRRDGAFADYVAVPVWNLVELDECVDFEEAAMMEPLAVALHAIKQSGLKEGDSFAVVGTGMIAFAAAQWAKRKGASSVTIFGRSETKRELAEKIGDVEYRIAGANAEGFDVVLEAVGAPVSIEQSIKYTKAGGTLVLMGNPSGNIEMKQDVYWRILRKQLKLIGTWNSSYESNKDCDWAEVKAALENKQIQAKTLISHTYTADRLEDGLELMRSHKEPYCKVMTVLGND